MFDANQIENGEHNYARRGFIKEGSPAEGKSGPKARLKSVPLSLREEEQDERGAVLYRPVSVSR